MRTTRPTAWDPECCAVVCVCVCCFPPKGPGVPRPQQGRAAAAGGPPPGRRHPLLLLGNVRFLIVSAANARSYTKKKVFTLLAQLERTRSCSNKTCSLIQQLEGANSCSNRIRTAVRAQLLSAPAVRGSDQLFEQARTAKNYRINKR